MNLNWQLKIYRWKLAPTENNCNESTMVTVSFLTIFCQGFDILWKGKEKFHRLDGWMGMEVDVS